MVKVMTTGTFDILHHGHINILKKAKEQGDYLIVGLNETKNGQPTMLSYEERKIILESIKYVDKVVKIKEQKDKYKYLEGVDLFVIGSDYFNHEDIELIEKYCNVKFIERTPNISSTQLKQRIINDDEFHRFVIDIDDTILFTENRDFENSVPNIQVIKKINQLYDEGWEIILYTARGAKSCKTLEERIAKYEDVTKRWLEKNNVKYHDLVFGKMNATVYVDDKAMRPDEFINCRVRRK